MKEKAKIQLLFIKFCNKQAGFTLVEMLVSVSIIGIMSTMYFTNYNKGGVGVDLSSAAEEMASKIRIAQNYSLGTKKFNYVTPLSNWGVHFDYENNDNSYKVFADLNGNYIFDEGEEYSTTYLPRNVRITGVTIASPVDVIFLPPDPRTYINGDYGQTVELTLTEDVNNTIKKININFIGLIDVIQ
ncbi:prepilin-type N-terminal cleavage/methylation domain-containing protein [Patescibacteria group bacterium]|nr:prepilin-type N-terminal cleavage/methylation domain-containing protein [Patescibacteria group bacterium]